MSTFSEKLAQWTKEAREETERPEVKAEGLRAMKRLRWWAVLCVPVLLIFTYYRWPPAIVAVWFAVVYFALDCRIK